MSASQNPAVTAPKRRRWRLQDRHGAFLRGRLVAYLLVAVIAAVGLPEGMTVTERELAVAMCVGAAVVQVVLWLAPIRWPERLLDGVNAALIVDAALILGLALVSNGCESLALWALPVLALAATVGHGLATGVKALILAAIVVGAVQAIDPDGSAEQTAGPLIMAAVVVAVAGVLTAVNERDLRDARRREGILSRASRRFVGVDDPAELRRTAEIAAGELLPGWQIAIDLDARPAEFRRWRDGEWAHLVVPLAVKDRDGSDRVLGALEARRHSPRVGSVRLSTMHLLPAIESLAVSLSTALSHAELVRQLAHLSLSDPLTGLGNRRAFDEALAEELARARRHGVPVGLVMLDVDHFKAFNDRHGHQAGDDALVAVATVLGEVARAEDRACRVGGEEFAVLLPGADEAAAAAVAERIRASVARARAAESITVSLGVAATRGERDAAGLFAQADERLYAAKQAGRNRVAGVSPAR